MLNYKLSNALPKDAVAHLVKAQQTPITAEDPLARQIAIEEVTKRIKLKYPHLFKD